MGRRPLGRKYPKHISIQVKEEHNEDLKFMTKKLNEISPLQNGKRWTIRDIILTLLYTQYNNSPSWYSMNHFESISEDQLLMIRNQIREGQDTKSVVRQVIKPIQKKSAPKNRSSDNSIKQPKAKRKLKMKINPDYQSYLEALEALKDSGGKN